MYNKIPIKDFSHTDLSLNNAVRSNACARHTHLSSMGGEALKHHARDLVRVCIWYLLNQHRPSGVADIFLLGARRSGTGLITQVITANRGVKSASDILDYYTATAYQLSRMLAFSRGMIFLELSAEQEQALCTYIEDILSGRLHVNENTGFWRRGFDFFSNRVVLKIINGPCLAPLLASRFNAAVILIFRHPIPQSLSCIRNGWPPLAPLLLSNRWFVSTFLDARLEAIAHDTLRNASELEKHVLTWCLENFARLQHFEQFPDLWMITYEHFLTNTDEVLRNWQHGLALSDLDRMQDALHRPSGSARGLSATHRLDAIQRGDTNSIISSWRKNIGDDEERRLMRILETFEIDLYKAGNILPTMGYRSGKLFTEPTNSSSSSCS